MTCATNGCKYGVFRDHLCAPCYHRAEQQREDLIRRKAAAFDKIANLAIPYVRISKPEWTEEEPWEVETTGRDGKRWAQGATTLDAVEAMEERG